MNLRASFIDYLHNPSPAEPVRVSPTIGDLALLAALRQQPLGKINPLLQVRYVASHAIR